MTSTVQGTFLHIGAGAAESLPPEAMPEGNLRCVLVEPNPAFSDDLDRFPPLQVGGPKVIRAAVDAQDGKATFHVLNLPELSRLDPIPEALRRVMPGLQVVACVKVPTISVESLLRKAKIRGTANRLMLEADGREALILSELIRLKALADFARIDVRTGPHMAKSPGLAAQFADQGFDVETAADPEEPDWSLFCAKRNDVWINMTRHLADLEGELARSEARSAEAEAALEDLHRKQDARHAEQKQIVAALEQARNQADTRMADLTAQLGERDMRIVTLEKELRQASGKADAQALALEQTRAQAADLEQQLAEARRSDEVEAWQRRCETAQDDLRLALQMQAVITADLKNLQTRHAALRDEKSRQDHLLAQLVARLDEAADHLHRLALPERDSAEALLEPEPEAEASATTEKGASRGKGNTTRKTAKPGL